MEYILLAEIKNSGENDVKYNVYSVKEDKICQLDKKQLATVAAGDTNFKFGSNKSIKGKLNGSIRLTKIIDGTVTVDIDTIIAVGTEGITLLKSDGITKYTVSKEEYTDKLAGKVNNEMVKPFSKPKQLYVKSYTDIDIGVVYLEKEEIRQPVIEENTSSNTENTNVDIKNSSINLENDNSVEDNIQPEIKENTVEYKEEEQREDSENTSTKGEFFSIEELTQEMNKVSSTKDKNETVDEIKKNVTVQENLSEKLDYNKIIATLYPMDKITIPYDIMSNIQYVILKVVDSNMESTITTGLCKIFRDKARINCTVAFITFNDETRLATVQCLGQTDDATKAVIGDIPEICTTYGKWLKESKFIRS